MTKSKLILLATLLIAGMAAMSSCLHVNNVVYSNYALIESSGWSPIRTYFFYPWPVDSIVLPKAKYDLLINIRYSATVRAAEIPIAVKVESGNKTLVSDTIFFQTRAENGRLLGRKELTVYELTDTVLRSFQLKPGTVLSLTTLSSPNNTRGMISVGSTLIENEDHIKELR